MEQFLGLSRDASREKSEAGTSPYARNVVFDKQVGSITQENGFIPQTPIRGLTIGIYSTNAHIVYITYLPSNGKTLISYVDMNTKVVTEVLETIHFGYSVERPIEIIAWYNYNQELLIMFSDGVFEKSSSPRLINLMDIGVELTITKEFLTEKEAETTLLFSNVAVPRYSILYGNKSTHDVDLLFFTIAYVLPDGTTTTRFLPTLIEAYPLYGFKSEYKKEIIFKIEDLDPFFSQFIIGIIAYRDNGIFAYTTDSISYVTSTYEYSFISVSNLNSVAVDAIVVETATFEKVKSLTIGNDSAILGGIVTKKANDYQKYANNLKLNLYFDYRLDNRHQAPLLCPDEVYYFTIAAAFTNGTYSEEFHIPNRDSIPADLLPIDKATLGLNDLTDINIPSFKIINTGDWVNPATGLPDFNDLEAVKLNWGYWQNEEVYPNNTQYDGTIDYDNTTVLTNGRDLRNTNVKLHRVPGLDNLSKKFPMRLGVDIKNETLSTAFDYHTRLPAFSINVDNFLDAFATVLATDNIVGYRLSFVKKDEGSKIVEDINFIKPLVTTSELDVLDETNVTVDQMVSVNAFPYRSGSLYRYQQFGFSKVKSINLSVYRGSRSPKIIKANYGICDKYYNPLLIPSNIENTIDKGYRKLDADNLTTGTMGQYSHTDNFVPTAILADTMLNIKITNPNLKYAVIQSIEQVPGNVRSVNNIFSHESIKLKAHNSNTIYPAGVTTPPLCGWNPLDYQPTGLNDRTTKLTVNVYNPLISAYENRSLFDDTARRINISSTLLNIKDNIHQGLQPKSFVTVGQTNINNPALLFKDFGDTFSNNIYNEISEEIFYYKIGGASANIYGVAYFQHIFSGMLAIDNNTLIEFVKDKILGYVYITDNSPHDYSNEVDKLLTFDYTKQIINKESTRQLNSLIANIAFYYKKKYINKFPYRIVKSLPIQTENLSTGNIRSFLANAYYDMPSIRGEITSVTGTDKGVYCQQRYSLSVFQLKEKLNNNDENSAYLAESDLFAFKPKTIIDEDNKGYIGSVHQFGRKLSKDGLLIVDAERGKIYIIGGEAPTEISKIKMSNFFRELLDSSLDNKVPTLFSASAIQDNPYNGNGIIFGVDDRTNRILITINNYTPLTVLPEDVSFINGIPYKDNKVLDIKNNNYTENKSNTLSFNLDWKRWVAEHDYYPQFYVNTNRRNYAGINSIKEQGGNIIEEKALVYITNEDKAKTGKYFYDFDNKIHESYIDLLFNSRYDLSKWYKSIMWRSTVKDINDNNIEEATINAILLYTDYQCSGRIELDTDVVSLIRNSEGLWSFNSFRDLAKNGNDLPIRKDGSFDEQKIYLNRNWFDKSDFISNFIIVRLIMNNIKDTQTHIHNVNTEARISDRI